MIIGAGPWEGSESLLGFLTNAHAFCRYFTQAICTGAFTVQAWYDLEFADGRLSPRPFFSALFCLPGGQHAAYSASMVRWARPRQGNAYAHQ